MREPFDVYSDQSYVQVSPYGAAILLKLTGISTSELGDRAPSIEVGTVRLSVEHLKTLVFAIKRQVKELEDRMNMRVMVPNAVLEKLKIAREDWEDFWRR